MKLILLPLLVSIGLVLSSPIAETSPRGLIERAFSYEQETFTFHGGPASYKLKFPADGNAYPTNNNLSISLIDPGSFDPYYYCNFYYNLPSGTKTPTISKTGKGNEVSVGPPAPIASVACKPTGANNQCLPVYATCEWCSQNSGCFLLNCCSGYCAATKCRPTS